MPDLDRRTFLALTAAAAARAVDTPKIRTGILGVQHSHLAPKLQALAANPAYEVVAACEPDDATRREHAADPGLQRLPWISVDAMLADRTLDLIVFEGEVHDAIPLGLRILESGKHLHLEKPPGNQLDPFQQLVDLARKRDRKLQLGYLWRYHAGTNAVLEAVRQGWLGEVYLVRATINADRDSKQRAIEARYPGGTMFELGGHMIDRVVALLGRPQQVRPWLRHDTSEPDTENDNTLAVLEYPKALALVMSAARDAAGNWHRSFEVIGTNGSMLVQPMEPAPTLHVHLRGPAGPYRKGAQQLTLPRQPRFIRDFEELARAIQGRSALPYSYDHELLLHETLLRASGELPGPR